MEISFSWLKKYIDTNLSAEEVARILTDIGLEVEDFRKIETIKGGLAGVVVGRVLTCEDTPTQSTCTSPQLMSVQRSLCRLSVELLTAARA